MIKRKTPAMAIAGVVLFCLGCGQFQVPVGRETAAETAYYRHIHGDRTYLGRLEHVPPGYSPTIILAHDVRGKVEGRQYLWNSYIEVSCAGDTLSLRRDSESCCLIRGYRNNLIAETHWHQPFEEWARFNPKYE